MSTTTKPKAKGDDHIHMARQWAKEWTPTWASKSSIDCARKKEGFSSNSVRGPWSVSFPWSQKLAFVRSMISLYLIYGIENSRGNCRCCCYYCYSLDGKMMLMPLDSGSSTSAAHCWSLCSNSRSPILTSWIFYGVLVTHLTKKLGTLHY